MSEVELGKRLERPTFTPYRDIDPFEAERTRIVVHKPAGKRLIEGYYDEEKGAVVANDVELCPVCGTKIIHESGCVRCTACGWSRC